MDDIFDDDIEPDEIDQIDQDDCDDCVEEHEELDSDRDKEGPVTEPDCLDPFWLGVAAGFGFDEGLNARKRKK